MLIIAYASRENKFVAIAKIFSEKCIAMMLK